jgi:hypothetical protein
LLSRIVHHTWQVVVKETGVNSTLRLRVVATHQRGAAAPQYYK